MGEKKKQTRQALYRKYRSKSLDEIIGQEHITKTLGNALKQDKISHAYLFTGPRGTGKTSIARILAHEINQLPYTDDSTHLDIIEIDAASNRRIDDIRDLRDKVHIAPLSVKYKVYIIDEVHMLTTESFNALLKTLEEPPEHVVFMLATTEVHKLPATIISRTQRHSLKPIDKMKIAGHLKSIAASEKIKISDDAVELLALHGNGSFRDSISLLDQLSTHSDTITVDTVQLLLGVAPLEQIKALLTHLDSGTAQSILQSVQQLIDSGLTPSSIANQIAQYIREEIVDGTYNSQHVELLPKLLSVHTALYQQLALEAILLETSAANPASHETQMMGSVPSVKSLKEESHPEPIQDMAQPTSTSTPTLTTPPPEDTPPPEEVKKNLPLVETFDIASEWQNILAAIKLKNNPLYTIMRLANYELSGTDLTLTFAFVFHQKRIDESKNKAMIAEVIREVCGYEVSIETVLDKTLAQNTPQPETTSEVPIDPAHASLIDDVRDIMGGGEIVNV